MRLKEHYSAREVAAILRKKLVDPVRMKLVPQGPSPVRIDIPDYGLCPRYSHCLPR